MDTQGNSNGGMGVRQDVTTPSHLMGQVLPSFTTGISTASVKRLRDRFRRGVRLFRGVKQDGRRPSDPGDFGVGLYHSTSRVTARDYGKLTVATITLTNPLILGEEEAYTQIADRFGTISGKPEEAWKAAGLGIGGAASFEERQPCAERATQVLMGLGYDGLVVVKSLSFGELEVVVYPAASP